MKRVVMVGLGTIAKTHLAVLARRTDTEVVAGVDPRGGKYAFPVHATLDDALDSPTEPDIVVVATPTDTHVEIVGRLLRDTGALVLSEKPLARTRAEVEALEQALGPEQTTRRVKVAHHFAFSPEVEWARGQVESHPQWGRPTRILSVFNDAYARLPSRQLAGYVSSWVDSGPNQLSLLAPFVGSWDLVDHQGEAFRSATRLEHDGGVTTLASNWVAGDTSKQTLLEFGGGEVELRMDHTSMTGLLLREGVVVEHVGYAGDDGRKEAHYLGLYDVLLRDPDDPRLGVALAASIAGLTEAGERAAAAGNGARWPTITSVG